MPDYSESNLKRNGRLLAVYRVVSMLLSLAYVPVVLGYLGTGLYGIWSTVLNIVSWVNYFDIGIGNGLRNKLSAALARKESDSSIKSLISSAYFMLALVVLGVMIISLVVFQFIDWDSLLGISDDLYGGAGAVIELSYALMCIGFIFSICKSLFFAVQQAHMVNLMGVVQQAAMLASVLLLTGYSGDKLMAVAVAYGVSALIVELVFSVIFFMKNRGWTPSFSMVSKKDALSVTGLGIQFFIVQIASLVLSTTDNIIVSNIFGPAAVTPYSTALKLFTVPVSLYVAVISPYWSSVTAQCATGDVTGVRRGIRRMQTLLWIVIVPCAILTIVFEPLTTLWLGQRLDMPAGLVWLNLIYAIIYSWNAIYSQVSNGMSIMRMMIAVAVLQAIVNIPLSFILASTIGSSSGVLLGTVLTMLLSAVVYPIYIKKRLKSMAAAGRSDGGIGK